MTESDPVNQMTRRQMQPHECAACPVETRGLYAAAHNAMLAYEAAQRGDGDWSRFHRKMVEVRDAVLRMAPIVEGHFADPAHSHPSMGLVTDALRTDEDAAP